MSTTFPYLADPVQHLHPIDGISEPLRDSIFENGDVPPARLRPIMARSPAFDRKSGILVPEGRLIKKLPDAVTCTTRWRNGILHRDRKEGPAWRRQDPSSERMQYIVNGVPHRDFKEGPALIDSNIEGLGICIEEHYDSGVPHRPSTEGPAVIDTGPNGQRLLEIYGEHGRWHRDPAEGPAHITYDAEARVTAQEYWWNGERIGMESSCVEATP